MASAEDDDANIEEDECTIEFGDEDQAPPPPSTGYPLSVDGPRFVEYPGEDFSKYLSESCLPRPDYDILDDLQENDRARRRYAKNIVNNAKTTLGRSRRVSTPSTAPPPPPPQTTVVDNAYLVPDGEMDDDATGLPITSYQAMIPPPASPPETRRKSRNTLRERVGRLFAAGGRQSSARSKSVERLSLANFTFADSKIGSLMLVQREQEQAAQAQESTEEQPETQSDLGVSGSRSWWDVGTLSSKNSVRLRNGTSGTKSGRSFARRNSDPNLQIDNDEADRGPHEADRGLLGSISRAFGRTRANRAGSGNSNETSPPSSETSATSSSSPAQQSSSASSAATSTAAPPLPPLRPKDGQGHEVKGQADGRGSRRGGNLFRRKKAGGDDRKKNHMDVVSAPRYTRINEEINQLTTDFRQATVDNPLP